GERNGNELVVRTKAGGQSSDFHIPVEGPVYVAASVRRMLISAGLEAGKRYEAHVFDPSVMKTQSIVTTVIGQEQVPGNEGIRAWRIEEEYAGAKSVAWLDESGHVLREEGPMGLVLVRESAETATAANWSEGTALDLVASVSIPVDPPLSSPTTLHE